MKTQLTRTIKNLEMLCEISNDDGQTFSISRFCYGQFEKNTVGAKIVFTGDRSINPNWYAHAMKFAESERDAMNTNTFEATSPQVLNLG